MNDQNVLSKYDNIEKLLSFNEMEKMYNELQTDEEILKTDLEALSAQRVDLEQKITSFNNALPNLQLVENDSQQLYGMISFTSTLAKNVSEKVRQLDLAKSRVSLCMQLVEDIMDLKFCTDGVQSALQNEDYEQAAAHIHRFLLLDEDILRMSADANESSSLDSSFKLLHESQTKLKTIIHNKFDTAVRTGDAASVERFFKTFPLIGEHEAGLLKFSKYLCSQISDFSDQKLKLALALGPNDKRANVIYSDTVTMLFEEIARIVEAHQPLVETYYGPGKLVTMIEFIQKECDRQMRTIISHFKTNRDFDNKVQLVQQASNSLQKLTIDPKDLDMLLVEITILNTRTELYFKFLRRRLYSDAEISEQDEEKLKIKSNEIERFLSLSESSCLMQELIGRYILIEEFFMRLMVIKAVSMDNSDEVALTSSMVDDSFFIVKKCVRRALSSSSVDGVCAMLNHARSLLEHDFRETLYNRLRSGFPSGFDFAQAYNFVQSTFVQGRLQNADAEAEKLKFAFLITLNNVEVSCSNILTLKSNIELEINKLYSHVPEQSKAKLKSCLSDLGQVSNRFKDALDFGFSQLVAGAIKFRIKPLIDTFLTVSHNITEEEFMNYEATDPWVQNFVFNLDSLLISFKSSLTAANYDSLIIHVANELTTQLEKAIFKTSFNRLGGLQLDKELRTIIGYLTSATTWSIRDKFSRLSQMGTVLNLDRIQEMLDYWGANSGPLTWRLTPAEVRQVLALRIDFKNEDINKLKL